MIERRHLARSSLILVALLLGSCSGLLQQDQSTPGDELTYEQQRGSIPPAPQTLRAKAQGNAVLVTWEPGAPVAIPHTYGDQVLYYKLYRRAGDQVDFVLLATVTETHFLDSTVVAGAQYHYFVVEIHKGAGGSDLSSGRSDEVLWGG